MCGHFGYITQKQVTLTKRQQKSRRRVVSALALAMQERGDHAAGIAAVLPDRVRIFKRAITAGELIGNRTVQTILRSNPNIVIGHTRYATTGARTDENSHPFRKGVIVGAHNGQVWNWQDIDPNAQVDSEAIFTALDKAKGNITALKGIEGDAAIAWIDTRTPDTLRLVAHNNPLTICRVPSLHTVFYCSTKLAMEAVMMASGLAHKPIYEPTENTVYSIDHELKTTKQSAQFKEEKPYTFPTTYSPAWNTQEDDTSDIEKWIDDQPCELCNKLHSELPADELKALVYFDYDTESWVCGVCMKLAGANLTYTSLTWDELKEYMIKALTFDEVGQYRDYKT